MAEFVEIYKTMAWPLQKKYLGNCIGWYTASEGKLYTIVHIWSFDSQSDREKRRKEMSADPDFKAYLTKLAQVDVLLEMENKIMTPTDFSLR